MYIRKTRTTGARRLAIVRPIKPTTPKRIPIAEKFTLTNLLESVNNVTLSIENNSDLDLDVEIEGFNSNTVR